MPDLNKELSKIRQTITDHSSNAAMKKHGYAPLYTASATAKIAIIGQAPGIQAQTSGIPWDDASGKVLREWLGLADDEFYDGERVAIIPMDFYYPGKGTSGDKPPRKDFAPMWHPQLLECMPDINLTILIGQYAQKYYLDKQMKKNLTQTVQAYQEYLPQFMPLVHPSPLNFRWQAKNPWFAKEVLPGLPALVRSAIDTQA